MALTVAPGSPRPPGPGPRAARRAAPRTERALRLRNRLLGVLGTVLVLGVVGLVVADYLQVFTPAVRVTVEADRSGLLTAPGSDVTLRGVTVGQVRSVQAVDGGARLTLALSPRQVRFIPADVTAEVVAPTVFGTKYVDLEAPAGGSGGGPRISAGAVLTSARVGTEINTLFQNLYQLLTAVQPAKVSATLGALAGALDGRGYRLGGYIDQLNTYLTDLDPGLAPLRTDLARLPAVAGAYAKAVPDLARTLDNLRTTSRTLVTRQAQLDAFLLDMGGLSGHANRFLTDNEQALPNALAMVQPITATMARYSSEFPCLFASANQLRIQSLPSLTGNPGLNGIVTILPGRDPYTYPGDLPKTVDVGPGCDGGPITKAQLPYPHIKFDDGSGSVNDNTSNAETVGVPPLAVQLFGEDAGRAIAKSLADARAKAKGAGSK
ncbi:MCE family protein [Phaeacidiphilus oryzae]|uniref:MCE family protein n=1 Tax=Phaeacidiphilus oryzae TaxID=348818 RepID=UPI00068C541F|nr:MCE family protein [Phaeacidiphilus oryzae]